MSAQPRKVVHPDIKPENTPALASGYLDVPNTVSYTHLTLPTKA